MIKQYKFAICDDDIQFCNKIKSYIIEYYGENKVEISNVIKLRNDGFEGNTKNVLLFFLWKI